MPRFPTEQASVGLNPGAVPQVRTNAEAIGQGMQSLGSGLSEMAAGLHHYQKLQDQKEKFNTANNIDTFKQTQNGALQTDLDHAQADGTNFTVTSMQRYDKDQETFIKSLPANQQESARQELAPYRQGYLNMASQKEHGLTAGNSTKILGDNYTSTLNAVNSDPTNRDTYLAGLKQRVDLAPGLSAAEKDDIYRNAEKGVAIQYVKALAPADPDKVRELQGYKPQSSGLPSNADAHLAGLDQKYSLPPGFLARTMQIESGGKDVPNKQGSSARGFFQFIPSTARRMGVDPHDFASSADGAARLARESADTLRPVLGREPTAAELYLAHQQGAGGAAKLLANPNAPAASIVGTQAVIQNGGTQGMTAGAFANMWINKFNRSNLPSYARAAVDAPNPSGAPATQSQAATSSNSYTPTSDPVLARLTPDDWNSLYNSARTQQNQNQAIARGNLEPVVQDATSALMTTGRYDGTMPTQQNFVAAYGAQEGAQRYSQFRQVQDIGQHIDAFKSMTPDQIQADIAAAKPVGAGEGFAMAQSRYEAMAKAGAATIKMRQDDPAGYVKSVNPQVAALWQSSNTADGYRTALAAMAAAQTQLGIAPQNQQLLPDDFTKQTIDAYKNDALPLQQRMAPVLNAILRTSDPDQQKAIFGQLVKAGLPTTMTGAIEAYSRGDQGAGDRLMSAIMVSPSKLPTDGAVKTEAINTAVAAIMAPGQIGNMAYGLQNGNPDNIGRAQDGMEILKRSAQLRVAQGETDATKAVNDAAKDLYGKQHAYSNTFGGMNFSAIIPDGANLGSLSRGVIAMRPQIETAVANAAGAFVREKNIAKGNPTTEAVMAADIKAQTANVMNAGQIINYGRDGFAFLDPYTNKFVPGADGKPLVFKLTDFEAVDKAAQAPDAQPQQSQGAPWFLGGAGQSGMNFLPPQSQAPAQTPSIPQPKPPAGSVPTSGNDAFQKAREQFSTDTIGGPM